MTMTDGELINHMGTDAALWAAEFMRIKHEIEASDDERTTDDEGWIIGWFANAIEAGRNSAPAQEPCIGCNEYPEQECPKHGRPYSWWVEAANATESRRHALEGQLDAIRALASQRGTWIHPRSAGRPHADEHGRPWRTF